MAYLTADELTGLFGGMGRRRKSSEDGAEEETNNAAFSKLSSTMPGKPANLDKKPTDPAARQAVINKRLKKKIVPADQAVDDPTK